jgi:RHS repeat-associated protein
MGFYLTEAMTGTAAGASSARPPTSHSQSIRTAGLAGRKPHRGPTDNRILSSKYRDESGLLYYGYRFYGAEVGRWLNRDPAAASSSTTADRPLDPAEPYGFAGGDPANSWDFLGLLRWQRMECQGCDAGRDYSHWGPQTCRKNSDGIWTSGNLATVLHRCEATRRATVQLCNTATFIRLRATNDECCKDWSIWCHWRFYIRTWGRRFAKIGMDRDFLGAALRPPVAFQDPPDPARPALGPYVAWIVADEVRSAVIPIPRGTTREVLYLLGFNLSEGFPNGIGEGWWARCEGRCLR